MKNPFRKVFVVLLFLFYGTAWVAKAQYAQFSQFYAAPLYLNPAMTGVCNNTRIAANYRNQWAGIGNGFITYQIAADKYIEKYRSGVGVAVMRDVAGTAAISSTHLALSYSYHLPVNKKLTIIPGMQAMYVQRNLNALSLTFPDQFTNNGFTGSATTENLGTEGYGYANLATGLLAYTKRFYAGVSAYHLNRPLDSFIRTGDRKGIPIWTTAHAGINIPVTKNKMTYFARKGNGSNKMVKRTKLLAKDILWVSPNVLFKTQGSLTQLDAGVHLTYEPIWFGVWYRGLPIKAVGNTLNQDALTMLIGLKIGDFRFGYSYDYTISSLRNTNTSGTHEISVVLEFMTGKNSTFRPIPCPTSGSFYPSQ